ncbi:MAG: right-handed parallel beta-helix repeat-containing protein [Planctomycetota bacterium]|jgi:hypothetical protein
MSLRSRCACVAVSLGVAFPVLAAPQGDNVWIVDNSGAPADFTELELAMEAAADGDVILVKPGNYGPFSMQGKGVSVIGDGGGIVRVRGPLEIRDLPANSKAVVRHLRTSTAVLHGMHLENCAGSVHLEDCNLNGQQTPTDDVFFGSEYHGIRIDQCADVRLSRCVFRGGDGNNVGFFGQPTSGADGLYAESSSVAVANSEFYGGHGADAPLDDSYSGGWGGQGIGVWDTRLWIDGAFCRGGNGGTGDYDYDLLFGKKQCGNGGHGGDGLSIGSYPDVWTGTTAPSEVSYRDLTGWGGSGGGTICGSPGDPGELLFQAGPEVHTLAELAGPARDVNASSPVRAGEVAQVSVQGSSGDFFLLLVGQTTPPVDLPNQPWPLAVAGNDLTVLILGAVDASGELSAQFPVPLQAAGFGAGNVGVQGVLLPVGELELQAAPVSVLTLVEQGL